MGNSETLLLTLINNFIFQSLQRMCKFLGCQLEHLQDDNLTVPVVSLVYGAFNNTSGTVKLYLLEIIFAL